MHQKIGSVILTPQTLTSSILNTSIQAIGSITALLRINIILIKN